MVVALVRRDTFRREQYNKSRPLFRREDMLRSAVSGALALLTATFVTASAIAQEKYPSKEIHFICAFVPGSGADVMVRFFADKISKKTGNVIVVENRPGGGGLLALTLIARAVPD